MLSTYNPFRELAKKIGRSFADELSLVNGAGATIPFYEAMSPPQREAIETKKRHVALAAGKQSGKTCTGVALLLNEIEKYPKDDFMIITPTVKRMEQSTLKKWLEMVKPLKIGAYFRQAGVFKLHSGGAVYLRTVEEDPEAIEGATLRAILADEAGDMPKKAYLNMKARVSVKRGRIFLTSSVYTANWFYEIVNPEYFDKEAPKNFFIRSWESSENPSFSEAEWEELREEMDPKDFDREYRAVMNRFEGLVYEVRDYNKVLTLPDALPEKIAGCDWGFKHPAAITVTAFDENWDCFLIDEFYGTGVLPQDLVSQAKALYEKHHFSILYCDSRRPELIAMMVAAGLPAYPQKKTDVAEGITVVRRFLTSGRLKFYVPAVPNTLKEAYRYCYKEDDNPYSPEVPVDLFNDCLDTVRMQLTSHYIPEGKDVVVKEKVKSITELDVERTISDLDLEDESLDAYSVDF